jgi:hypothetical protein
MAFRFSGSYRVAGFFGALLATLIFLSVATTDFSKPKTLALSKRQKK